MLIRHGYGVLLVDRRGEGESDGDPNPFGWNGDRDIKAAIAFLKGRPDVDPARIGGLGLSVGGELMLETAAETEELRAVVSEGAGSRWVGEDVARPGGSIGRWLQTGVQTVAYGATAVFSGDAPPPRLQIAARRITQPAFLVYSDDGVDTEDLNPRYYDELAGPKQIWQTGTGHIKAATERPAEYERRVVGFFDRALRPVPVR
jgi:predicted acyl esterase